MKSKNIMVFIYAVALGLLALSIFWNGRDGRRMQSNKRIDRDEHIGRMDLTNVLVMRNEKRVVFIDLRPWEEFNVRHIAGALPIYEDEQRKIINTQINNKDLTDQIFVLYATRSFEIRSAEAEIIKELSGKHIRYYPGGIDEWSAAGLEMESGGME